MQTTTHCYRTPLFRRVYQLVFRLTVLLFLLSPSFLSLVKAEEAVPQQGITFWLLDDEGNWKVPLPNWSVDDIAEILDQTKPARQPTSWTILALDVNGEVVGQRAQLEIEYKISLTRPAGGDVPVRIPLGMNEGIFRTENGSDKTNFDVQGPGRVLIDVDPENGGYAALVYPDPVSPPSENTPPSPSQDEEESPDTEDEEKESVSTAEREPLESARPLSTQIYSIRLKLLFPVQQTAGSDEYTLPITPPPAVRSQASLVVPLPDIEISTSEGLIADPPVSIDEKSSQIKVYGFNRSGAVTAIRWRSAKKNDAPLPVTYHVEKGTIDLTPTGNSVDYDVRLPIRVFGGNRSSFGRLLRVELPIGALADLQNVHASTSGGADIHDAVCREIPASEIRPHPAIEVSVPDNIDALTLRFTATVPTEGENKWECTGFHLDGALKETGEIIVHLSEDENILPFLVLGDGVRDVVQPENAEGAEKSVRFRFNKEPFSLKSDPISRQTRLIAQPEFQVLVGEHEMRLKARIAYSVYGAPLREVRVKGREWLLAQFGSESNIDVVNIHTDPQSDDTTILPLKKPVEGDFILTWESPRSLDNVGARENSLDSSIEFGFPEIIADWVASPLVAIVPDDNIELLPLNGKNGDLVQALARPAIDLPHRERQPLLYQIQKRGNSPEARTLFSARFIPHKGSVSVESHLTVRLDHSPAEMVQTLEYNAEYVPVPSLEFLVPKEIDSPSNLSILLDGKPVSPDQIADRGERQNAGFLLRSIRLPAPGRIGLVRLELHAPLKLSEAASGHPDHVEIPLVIPVHPLVESDIASNENPAEVRIPGLKKSTVEVTALLNWNLSVPDGNQQWKETETNQVNGTRLFRFDFVGHTQSSGEAISLPGLLPLQIEVDNTQNAGGLTAEQIWVQTVMGSDSYYEGIRYCLSGNRQQFNLKLPEGARSSQIAVAVNGVSIDTNYSPEERILHIPLPGTVKAETAVVSLWYQISRTGHELEFPDLMGETMVRRCLLQLILPSKTLLRTIPHGWSSEYDEFNREESMGEFAAAMGDDALPPPKNANVYLLSSFNPPTQTHVHTINRAALVIIGSGIILLLGTIFLYVPNLRRYELFPLLVILAAAVILFRPAVVFYYMQYCAFGFILILLILLIKTQTGRRRIAPPVHTPSSLHKAPAPSSSGSQTRQPLSEEEPQTKTKPPEPPSDGETPSPSSPVGEEPQPPSVSEPESQTPPQTDRPSDLPPETDSNALSKSQTAKQSAGDAAHTREPAPSDSGSTATKPIPDESGTENV